MTVEELTENFEFLDEWTERYRYLIELGRELEPLSDDERAAHNLVSGCISKVWLVMDAPSAHGTLHFRADSDAHIVKGLVRIALLFFQGKTRAEIESADPLPLYEELGLDEHLSVNRRNGFVSMLGRIKALSAHVGS